MESRDWELEWLDLDGARVAVFACGPRDGKPIVFFHGLGHWALGSWSLLAPYLADRYRLIAFDMPGFGVSDKPDVPYDLAYFTATCKRVVASVAPGGATLVGHSLGGLIAASVAAEHPMLAHRLFLINSTGFKIKRPWVVQFLGNRMSAPVFAFQPSRWVVRRAIASAVHDPRAMDPSQFERVYTSLGDPLIRRTFARIYAAALHEVRERNFVRIPEILGRYRGPTTAIFGKNDPYIPGDVVGLVRGVYPHAHVELAKDCGHFAQLECPALIAERIDALHALGGRVCATLT